MNAEDRRLLALAALPAVDLAESELAGTRKAMRHFGTMFPIHCAYVMFYRILEPFMADSGLQPAWLVSKNSVLQILLEVALGLILPLLFVVGLILSWMNGINLWVVALSFLALEISLMFAFRMAIHTLWTIDFEPNEPCWIDLDRTVHELGLAKELMLPTFSSVPLNELDAWLTRLHTELNTIANASDPQGS